VAAVGDGFDDYADGTDGVTWTAEEDEGNCTFGGRLAGGLARCRERWVSVSGLGGVICSKGE
jgi:hypothetical protein